MKKKQLWVATMILLVWVKLMNPLQAVFQDFFLLVKMIALMIGTLGHQSGRPVFAMFLKLVWDFREEYRQRYMADTAPATSSLGVDNFVA